MDREDLNIVIVDDSKASCTILRTMLNQSGFKNIKIFQKFSGNVRFWRTYKYECLYLREVKDLKDVKEIMKEWVKYYDGSGLHQALGYGTPDEVYYGRRIEVFTKRC